MGLFSGLEAFGLKTKNLEVYSKEEKKEVEHDAKEERVDKIETVIKEEDCLFPKTYKCPICDKEFKTLAVRAGKVRNIGRDQDLRPLYREMDPLKYDAIVCPQCGYAAISRYFDNVLPRQRRKLQAEIMPNFRGIRTGRDVFSYDDAIMRYKMVLLCDVVSEMKDSRKAYTCLKLAWVIRGKLEKEGELLTAEEREKLSSDEMECIRNAYDGYVLAIASETYPMSGMDELTVMYLMAELAYKLEKYTDAMQMLAKVMGSSAANHRIKESALELKERIRVQVNMKK